MALKMGLHAQLARAVCTLPSLQPYITGHLVSYLAAYSWADPLEAAWLSSVIPDVVDAVQSVEGTRGEQLLLGRPHVLPMLSPCFAHALPMLRMGCLAMISMSRRLQSSLLKCFYLKVMLLSSHLKLLPQGGRGGSQAYFPFLLLLLSAGLSRASAEASAFDLELFCVMLSTRFFSCAY